MNPIEGSNVDGGGFGGRTLEDLALGHRLRSWSPAVSPPVFDRADVAYVVTDTAVGRILLARRDAGPLLVSRYVPDSSAEDALLDRIGRAASPRVLRLPARLDEARRQLDDYLTGRRRTFELDVDLALTTRFQRSVLTALARSVGYGEHTTYGALAVALGAPSAARAVGAALAANPVCILLPCHRVLGAHGELTGYAGGVAAKRYLLDLEGGS